MKSLKIFTTPRAPLRSMPRDLSGLSVPPPGQSLSVIFVSFEEKESSISLGNFLPSVVNRALQLGLPGWMRGCWNRT